MGGQMTRAPNLEKFKKGPHLLKSYKKMVYLPYLVNSLQYRPPLCSRRACVYMLESVEYCWIDVTPLYTVVFDLVYCLYTFRQLSSYTLIRIRENAYV